MSHLRTPATCTWIGKLMRRPFPARPTPANTDVFPLNDANDFAVTASFAGAPLARVLLNFAEHYELLGTAVSRALELLPEAEFILLRLNLPGGRRLPVSLLDERVLILQDVEDEAASLAASGRSLLVFADRFVRTDLELGDNHLSLAWYGDPAVSARFDTFVRELGAFGIDEVADAS